jgi:Zn-dependent peptidase ImmA (M78 family)
MSRFTAAKAYKDPKFIAEEMLRKSDSPRLSNGYAIDVERIARDYCGFEVMHIDDLEIAGKPALGLYVHAINALMVTNNCYEPRKRFSIAHEIGHAQLEYDYGDTVPLFELDEPEIFGCTEEDQSLGSMDELKAGLRQKKERRANKFAAHLLMPEGLVREVWRRESGIADRVAATLAVSKEALGFQLQEFNLKWTRANASISAFS